MTCCTGRHTVPGMRWLVFAWIALAGASASAQTPGTSFVGGDFNVEWDRPNSTEGRIDCSRPEDSGCSMLNRAACDEAGTDTRVIEATLSPTATTQIIPASSKLFVWIEPDSAAGVECEYSKSATEHLVAEETLGASHPLVTRSSWSFPDDLATPRELPIAGILRGTAISDEAFQDACAEGSAGVEQVYRLCFGVDLSTLTTAPDGLVQPGGTANEPQAWLRILVDTKPPPNLENAQITELDGRLRVTPEAAADPDATDTWWIRWRPVAELPSIGEPARPATDCLAWEGAKRDDEPATLASVEISTPNGSDYEGCIYLMDAAGNLGEAWYFTGTPMDQCDFVECYPGDLQGGYCGALTPAPLAAASIFLLWRRRRVRR